MSSVKNINDLLTIVGFFREAVFHSRSISIKFNKITLDLKIIKIKESSTRSKNESRYLVLEAGDELNLERILNNPNIQFSCAFPKFIAEWSGLLKVSKINGAYEVEIPSKITIRNSRLTPRIAPLNDSTLITTVNIQSGNLHSEAVLKIINFSRQGLGGELQVPAGIPVLVHSTLRGHLKNSRSTYQINGKIINIQLLGSNSKIGTNLYRIGLTNEIYTEPRNNNNERRKFKRINANLNIDLISPLNGQHIIELDIVDASISGFSAKFRNPSDTVILPMKCGAIIKDTSIIAEVVGYSSDKVHMQIFSGTSNDRLLWLNKLAHFKNEHTTRRNSVGTDLIDLFCNSGGFSAEYLHNQASRVSEFNQGMSADSHETGWVHRWMEQSKDGSLKGHISAIRFADNLWHVGDVVGSREPSNRISKEFIPKFLDSFREYCNTLKPCPRVVVSFNEGHKYWENAYSKIQNKKNSEHIHIFRTEYTRIPRVCSMKIRSNDKIIIEKIVPNDFEKIELTAKSIANKEFKKLLKCFDFSIESFGSPALTEIIRQNNCSFTREYFTVQLKQSRYVIILHSFPIGANPQRSLEVPWLIPIKEKGLTNKERQSLLYQVSSEFRSRGFSFPGIICPVSKASQTSALATKKMIWIFGHPNLLHYFVVNK